jgi:DNA-3-methyladenine glycosylase II
MSLSSIYERGPSAYNLVTMPNTNKSAKSRRGSMGNKPKPPAVRKSQKLHSHATAHRALSRLDPKLRPLIQRVGPCTLKPHDDHFALLIRTIISQQLSTTAARTIGGRLHALSPAGFQAAALEQLSDEQIRGCGISSGKLRSIRDLCGRVRSGSIDIMRWPSMPDEELREQMLEIHGIGPWSVDMYLIFGLGRMDVLPVGDLGLRMGVKEHYRLSKVPTPAQLFKIAECWRPYRAIATWYFWRSRGPVTQS